MFRLFALGVCDVAAGTLAWSGLVKLVDPRSFAVAASSLRLVGSRRLPKAVARAVGVCEVVLAAVVIVVGSTAAFAALAVAYGAFALVTARAVVAGVESCGCFGARSVKPTWTHAVLDAVVAASAATVAGLTWAEPLPDRLDPSLATAAIYVVFVLAGAAAFVAALTMAERPAVVVPARVGRR